jgi:hypothetical protein
MFLDGRSGKKPFGGITMSDDKKTFKVSGKIVSFHHETKTIDGSVWLTTRFDFTNVSPDRLIYDAGSSRLIKWRASSGIKEMTTADALKKFSDLTVDCSKTVERAEASEEVKELREAMKDPEKMQILLNALEAMKK